MIDKTKSRAHRCPLTAPLLRVLISMWRAQDFKGWDRVSVSWLPQMLPHVPGRSYTPLRALRDCEALYEIGLVKRFPVPLDQRVVHKRKAIETWDYAISKAGQELIDVLLAMGLPRWVDL